MRAGQRIRELLRLIWSESTPFVRVRLCIALALVLASGMLAPLGPVALKLIVDGFSDPAAGSAGSVAVLVALYVLSQWLSRSLGELRNLAYTRAERRMFRTLSERLFGHILRLPLRFHLERQTGAVTQALENGLQGYKLILYHLLFTLLPVCVQLLTIAVILVRFDQPMFLLIFGVALVSYALAYAQFARQVSGLSEAAAAARVDANGTVTDSLLNFETVKLFTAEEMIERKVSGALAQTEQRWGGFYSRSTISGLVVATLYAAFLGAAITYAVHEVRNGRMTIGDFVLVNSYMLQVLQPVEMLGRAMQSIAEGAGMLERLLGLFRERPEPEHSPLAHALSTQASLEFRNVGVGYFAGRRVLEDVSFDLASGRTLAVVGTSGAGKSTIVRLLVRLIEPESGEIRLDGVPISNLSLSVLRRAISVVPQDTVLFNETLAYNIGLARPGCARQEIEAAARVARLDELVRRLPEGYETRVGERGLKLSGGEKQRVSIARAVLKQPRILVFDEATSSLDTGTEREVLQNLAEISKCRTTLVIAHRLSTVVHADEILVLDQGRIVEQGSHSELLRLGGQYAKLWAAQQTSSPTAAADVAYVGR